MFSEFKSWLKSDKYNIGLTLMSALLPSIATFVYKFYVKKGSGVNFFSVFILSEKVYYAITAFFVFFTLFLLIYNMQSMVSVLKMKKEQIKNYMAKNCDIKIFNNELDSSYRVVRQTVIQFYFACIMIWFLWLVLYFGNFLYSCFNSVCGKFIFVEVFDFLSSTTMFVVYIILSNVTVNIEKRIKYDNGILYGVIVWLILATIWLIALITSVCNIEKNMQFVSIFSSMYASITFVLVLGKLNSNYLQVPRLFMWVLYIYAIIQAYYPIVDIEFGVVKEPIGWLNNLFPYITLLGKLFFMLTLCWVAYRRRFIFFVIHKSISLDEVPRLLTELNKEKV